MGFSTRFLGRLDIEPRLNAAEVEWLKAFAELDRRFFTHPYDVPMNPRAFRFERERLRTTAARDGVAQGQPVPAESSEADLAPLDPFSTLAPLDGSPYPHLDWAPCVEGCCLTWDSRTEKSRMAEEWLRYLIDHFLRPGALARTSARPDFTEFTFDHRLNGIIAAERDDTRELWVIQCRDNEISTLQLVPPDSMPWELNGSKTSGRR